ncbi:MAG: hypothetical protein ACYC4L_02980 [Chloroflexota bacterium]
MAEAERRGLGDRLDFRATFCHEACEHGTDVQVNGVERQGLRWPTFLLSSRKRWPAYRHEDDSRRRLSGVSDA